MIIILFSFILWILMRGRYKVYADLVTSSAQSVTGVTK